MTHDFSDGTMGSPGGLTARGLLLAGVAGASLLGIGLGLWARPAMSERRMAAVAASVHSLPPAPSRQLQIVVDDAPAPVGKPIEVLPAETVAPAPPDVAPVRSSQALVKTQAPAQSPKPPVKAQVARAVPRLTGAPATKAKPVLLARADQTPKARPQTKPIVLAARTDHPHHGPSKAAVFARLAPQRSKDRQRPQVEKVSNGGPGHKSHPATKPARLMKAVGHPPKASARKPEPVRYAPPPRPRAHASAPPPKPVGLMKVSNRSRCALADRAAALVCADPSLGAADRQLARAYSNARAAGVSDERLRQQQQRWLAARAAAAREAPWAVHDVYLARIAQLNGQAREAQGGQ